MTKKRFYKLLRAFAIKTGGKGKEINRVCTKQLGLRRGAFDDRGYQYLWDAITINGKNADGVGVKARIAK